LASWLATAVGLAGGIALALGIAQAALPGLIRASQNPRFAARMALAGALVHRVCRWADARHIAAET